jgi:hypothetical protein
MNAPSVDVAAILEAESSLDLTFADNLFVGREPAAPDNCVTIFDTTGGPPQHTLAKGEDYYYDGVNIRVRNNSYTIGYNLALDIVRTLHGIAQETWNGTLYSMIKAINTPAMLDWDDNDRCRFTINFEMQRR